MLIVARSGRARVRETGIYFYQRGPASPDMKVQPSEYFSRLTAVPEIQTGGLQRLRTAHVAVVGVGGVGGAAAFYLAQTGVGHLRLIDQDVVEPNNLHRLHCENQYLYHPKAEAAAETLSRFAPWTATEPMIDTLRSSNIEEFLGGSDVIVDGLDNFRTRYLVNQYSYESRTPYLFAGAVRNQGHLGLFHPPETGCLKCVLPGVVDCPEESCEALGVTPSITGLVGAFAASEVTKLLVGTKTRLLGSLLTLDTLIPDMVVATVTKRNECETCGSSRMERRTLKDEPVLTLCGGTTVNVLPRAKCALDLERVLSSIPRKDVLRASGSVLVFRRGDATVSLFRNGRVLIDGVEGREEALEIAGQIWEQFTSQVTSSA